MLTNYFLNIFSSFNCSHALTFVAIDLYIFGLGEKCAINIINALEKTFKHMS